MRRMFFLTLLLLLTPIVETGAAVALDARNENTLIKHELRVSLDPGGHRFSAEDTITIPQGRPRSLRFSLHKGLDPVVLTPKVTAVRESERQLEVPVEVYRVSLPQDARTLVLKFGGEIFHPISPSEQEIARGRRDTPGIISKEGVFLSGGSHWYPQFDDELITFNLEVTVPRDWDVVSQGERTSHEVQGDVKRVTWRCDHPQEEMYVIAARFFEYSRNVGNTELMVFLRDDDRQLADTYLAAAARYLPAYEHLLGPYPYKKFALVENFWETGYGMPSFALMGPKVIRFPFIVDSSYPHEILHNWWGNGVYPDPKSGNWSEGLTAYLSDYLIQEQRGTARQYRRDILQKFAAYVSRNKDFPLNTFQSRHSAATQAVGYGKALMFFHMLRMELGDEAFVQGLQRFYRDNMFAYASFDDMRRSFEAVSGKDLRGVFHQWVDQSGAPQLKIRNADVKKQREGYLVTVTLEQPHAEAPYSLSIPVAITMEGQEHAYLAVVHMTEKVQVAEFRVPSLPLRMDVDPEFDVFRRLDLEEIPPALSQVFGAKKLMIVMPSSAGDALAKAFQELAQAWRESGPDEVAVVKDSDVQALPSDASIVLLGWENRFFDQLLPSFREYSVGMENHVMEIQGNKVPQTGHSVALSLRNPKNKKLALAFIGSDSSDAIHALARKLPHYHSYGYLVFDGDKAVNSLKGYWPVTQSPMTVFFPGPDGTAGKVPMGKLVHGKPLANMASTDSRKGR